MARLRAFRQYDAKNQKKFVSALLFVFQTHLMAVTQPLWLEALLSSSGAFVALAIEKRACCAAIQQTSGSYRDRYHGVYLLLRLAALKKGLCVAIKQGQALNGLKGDGPIKRRQTGVRFGVRWSQ